MFESAKYHEKQDNYEIVKQYGFIKPSPEDRKIIKETFQKIGITIHGIGYDLIDIKTKQTVDNGSLGSIINDVYLYELKTTWRDDVASDFKGFTFGITENEILNSITLKDKFKIVLLNGKTGNISIRYFQDIQVDYSHTAYFFSIGNSNKKIISFKDLIII